MKPTPTPLNPGTARTAATAPVKAQQTLSAEQYKAISEFLELQAGIRLGAGKEYLVTSRLARMLEEFRMDGFEQLGQALRAPGSQRIQAAVVDAMTTNETFWFRDPAHFRSLTNGVFKENPPARARIWSAAASTGQEVYTIAISLQDAMRAGTLPRGFRYEIVGTDISPTALAQARSAHYCGVSAGRGLTPEQRAKYFSEQGDCIDVLPAYRTNISLREFNLMKSFDLLGRFDVIFCRNVLIYFSQELKRDLIERFARALNPGGHLFLGSTESMSAHGDLFEMRHIEGGLAYRRRD